MTMIVKNILNLFHINNMLPAQDHLYITQPGSDIPEGRKQYKKSIHSKWRNRAVTALLIGGFLVLILSGAVALFNPISPIIPLIACCGLALHAVGSKIAHNDLDNEKKAIEKENARILLEQQHAHIQREYQPSDSPNAFSQIHALSYKPLKFLALWYHCAAYFFQVIGIISLFSGGISALYPEFIRFTGILIHVGWATFTAGSQLESYYRQKERDYVYKLNKQLKESTAEEKDDISKASASLIQKPLPFLQPDSFVKIT